MTGLLSCLYLFSGKDAIFFIYAGIVPGGYLVSTHGKRFSGERREFYEFVAENTGIRGHTGFVFINKPFNYIVFKIFTQIHDIVRD